MNETAVRQFHAQFQTFDDPPEAAEAAPRVAALRAELARRGLDGFVVPHADRHQNEYVAPAEDEPEPAQERVQPRAWWVTATVLAARHRS